ncbi:MAG: hypothetical protein HOW73_28050 [Polyangiaceae bacterium]|nr:hypothetical protein [Polyangiaceae bacterium]
MRPSCGIAGKRGRITHRLLAASIAAAALAGCTASSDAKVDGRKEAVAAVVEPQRAQASPEAKPACHYVEPDEEGCPEGYVECPLGDVTMCVRPWEYDDCCAPYTSTPDSEQSLNDPGANEQRLKRG